MNGKSSPAARSSRAAARRGATISRIAILFEYGTLGGGERSMLAVIDRLGESEFEFIALAPPEGRLADALAERSLGHIPLCLHDEAGNRRPREQACGELLAVIKKASPDLVHANSLAMGRLSGAITGELTVPCVAHLRDILKLSKKAAADLNRNRVLIAVSRATKKFHLAQGLSAEKLRVIYNGVDCERFRPRKKTGYLARELGLSEGAFLITTIGQIGLRKGQDMLAEAAALAAGRMPEAHYLLIGERNSAKRESIEFERNVARRFEQAGLEERLHRPGYREDVAQILNEIDLLVHPAKQEPLGRVLLEAAAAGTAIVATDVGGTAEILKDGETARLVAAGDAGALAGAMAELHDEPNLRHRLGERARQWVSERFGIESAALKLAGEWRESVAGR